jgi:hypothetical protein
MCPAWTGVEWRARQDARKVATLKFRGIAA